MSIAHRETPEVQSVARAISLLDAFDRDERVLGVGDLARRTGLHASTVSRLLATLERGRLVSRTGDGRYALGLRLVSLAALVPDAESVRAVAGPVLEALRDATAETANLLVADGDHALYLDQRESLHVLRHTGWLGRRVPGAGTAAGAALAGRPGAQRVDDAVEPGVTAIAAGVAVAGGPALAIGITGPSFRLAGAAGRAAERAVAAAATDLSARLAHPSATPEEPR